MPSYAVIIRELFPAQEAGLRQPRISTLAGMALGGWLAGAIYDWTGSYAAALVNGIAWNIVNMAIVFGCCRRMPRAAGSSASSPPLISRRTLALADAVPGANGHRHEPGARHTRLYQSPSKMEQGAPCS